MIEYLTEFRDLLMEPEDELLLFKNQELLQRLEEYPSDQPFVLSKQDLQIIKQSIKEKLSFSMFLQERVELEDCSEELDKIDDGFMSQHLSEEDERSLKEIVKNLMKKCEEDGDPDN